MQEEKSFNPQNLRGYTRHFEKRVTVNGVTKPLFSVKSYTLNTGDGIFKYSDKKICYGYFDKAFKFHAFKDLSCSEKLGSYSSDCYAGSALDARNGS